MKPTLQTVADVVGVSRSTVSNAYSRPARLSRELRDKSFDAAKKLGYAGPHAAARSLRRGRAGAIGVLFTDSLSYAFVDPYAVRFLRGLSESAERHDTGLLLLPLSFGDRAEAERKVREAVVDGFCVYCVPEWHVAMSAVKSRGLPIVTTEYRKDAEPTESFVGVDDYAAAFSAASHVARLGHRRFAVLSVMPEYREGFARSGPHEVGAIESITDVEMRERLLGFRDALAKAGVEWEDVTVTNAVTNSRAAGNVAASYVLDQADRPTAVLAGTDLLALGTLDAAASRGLRAGRDVSVTGFDDIPDAKTAGLTTVRQPAIDKGVIAGELLLDPPDEVSQRQVLLPTELIVRASTGPIERR
ncbi:MAG: LacI family DNA-binding transcriptional regulator [Stackebrandtia sp.]